jgi:uncharacterized protein YoxC
VRMRSTARLRSRRFKGKPPVFCGFAALSVVGCGVAAANFGGYCNEVDLRECINGLREAINDLREAVNDLREAVNDLWEAVNDLWEAVNDLWKAVNDLREAVNDFREAVNDLREAVNDLREAVNDLREAVNDLRETVNGLGASDAVPSRGQRAATKQSPFRPLRDSARSIVSFDPVVLEKDPIRQPPQTRRHRSRDSRCPGRS